MKNENLGIYVTWTLFGAGAGLTVGSILVSLLEKRRISKEMSDMSKDIVERANKIKDQHATYTREGLENGPQQTNETPEKKESLEESVREGLEAEATDQEQYAALASVYDITPAQQQLWERGVVTLDQLQEVLEEDAQTYVDYYDMGASANSASLEELYAAEGVPEDINPQYKVTTYVPEGWDDSKALWEFGLIGEFEILGRIHRSSRSIIPVDDVETIIPDGIYEEVLDGLRFGPDGDDGAACVYVIDYEKNRRLTFRMFEKQEQAVSS